MTRQNFTIWLVVLAVGCSPPVDLAPSDGSTGTPPVRSAPVARPDSGRIIVAGPTLVVYFRGAYTAVDSGGDNAEVLGDLQYHLGSARPALDSLGVAVQERYGEHIDYELDDARSRFTPAADSGRAAYLFLAPGVAAHVHYGVLMDIDLTSEVRSRFKPTARTVRQ